MTPKRKTDPEATDRRLRVGIAYHYFAHYRAPVLREMIKQRSPAPAYVLMADDHSNLPALVCLDEKSLSRDLPGENVEWRDLENRWIGKRFLWQRGLIGKALSKDLDAIVLLGNVYFLSTWVAAVAARLSGKHVLMWTHGALAKEAGAKGWVRSVFYRLAHDLLLYGHRAKDILAEGGIDASRMHVVYNSLDYDAQVRLRKPLDEGTRRSGVAQLFPQLEIGDATNRALSPLLFVGRLLEDKGVDLLLEVVASLASNSAYEIVAIVVGEGPARESLERQARALGITDRVHFEGACYEETRIAELFSYASLCVIPGDLGLSGIHSLTYGTPVITHDDLDRQKPEFEAVREGVSGAYYRRGDATSLADTVLEWLESADRSDEVRKQCMQVVDERYNPKAQVEIINRVLLNPEKRGGSSHA